MRPWLASLLVISLFGFEARANDEVDAWFNRTFSQDAYDRMRGAIEAKVSFGYGTFSETSTSAFRSSSSGSSSPWFGGGTALIASAGYRWRFLGLGLEGTWYSFPSEIVYPVGVLPTNSNAEDSFSASEYALYERVHLSSVRSRIQLSFDLHEGLGSLTDTGYRQANATTTDFVPYTTSFNAGVGGARLNIDFRPYGAMPGLQLGAFVGASAWIPYGTCATTTTGSQCSGSAGLSPNFAFSVGIAGSFVLPVGGPPALEYVLVASRPAPTPAPDGAAREVQESEAYHQKRGGIRQVALAAPASCQQEAAQCSAEMAELERGLIKQGFVVTSWRDVDAMVRDAHVTPAQAAERLGAQVLFNVTALERLTAQGERTVAGDYRFFASDSFGSQGAAVSLADHDKSALEQIWEGSAASAQPRMRAGAKLAVDAVLASSGEAFWSYHREKLERGSADLDVSVLARRDGDTRWMAAEPSGIAPRERAAEASDALIAATRQAAYYRVLREVVSDCVRQFAAR